MKQILIAIALVAFTTDPAMAQLEAAFVPDSETWERWTPTGAGVEASTVQWDRFLARYVKQLPNGNTAVDYGAVTAADRETLKVYVSQLEALRPTAMTRAQQKAYWINLYNAATVSLVLDHYPVSTIRKIHGGIFRTGPWGKDILKVEGVDLSLSDIEHRILRPIFDDARVHYALNCASVGCPDLRMDAFTPASMDAQLDSAARNFINSDRAFRLEDGDLVASSIFLWYADDFGGKDKVLAHALPFANDKTRALLSGRKKWDDTEYDWDLNDAR